MFSQNPYQCKFEYGIVGLKRGAERGDIIIIVDCLSFTTAVAIAVFNGGKIIPCDKDADLSELANKYGAEVAVGRNEVPEKGRYSLSPKTYLDVNEGTAIILPSLNGSTCSSAAGGSESVFAGSFVNAQAVALYVEKEMIGRKTDVTIVACGEREKGENPKTDLRFAIEDYLGAGAILSYISKSKSPEAEVCRKAFLSNKDKIEELIWDSVSGRELRFSGYEDDVRLATQLNSYPAVPVLKDGVFIRSEVLK